MYFTLKDSSELLLKKYGLLPVGNYVFSNIINLPMKEDLFLWENTNYDYYDKATKIELIKSYIYENNHFKIIDMSFFLPNLKVNERDKPILKTISDSIDIYFINDNFRFTFSDGLDGYFEMLLDNKDFVQQFSKEFQMKIIFINREQTIMGVKKEIVNSITTKMNELGIDEIFMSELPRLIMHYLDEQKD